jgi:WD40 repeat protein
LCARDTVTSLLDATTGEEVATLTIGWIADSHRTAFSPRGTYLLTSSKSGEHQVRDGRTGTVIETIPSPGNPRSMAISSDETMIAFAASIGSDPRPRERGHIPVVLLTLPSGTKLGELQVPTTSQVDTLRFVGNGLLAAGTYDDLTIFDTRDQTIVKRLAAPSQMSFGSMSISPDGRTMIVTGLLGTSGTNLWDIESNSLRKELSPERNHHIRFGIENTVVSWGTGRTIAFLDGTTGSVQKELLLPNPSNVRDVAASFDMGVVAAAAGGTAWIWDHGSDPVSLQDAPREIQRVMVSGDGRSVAVTGMDVTLFAKQLSEQLQQVQK